METAKPVHSVIPVPACWRFTPILDTFTVDINIRTGIRLWNDRGSQPDKENFITFSESLQWLASTKIESLLSNGFSKALKAFEILPSHLQSPMCSGIPTLIVSPSTRDLMSVEGSWSGKSKPETSIRRESQERPPGEDGTWSHGDYEYPCWVCMSSPALDYMDNVQGLASTLITSGKFPVHIHSCLSA